MKRNLFASGLIAILTDLVSPQGKPGPGFIAVLHRQPGRPVQRESGGGRDQVQDRGLGLWRRGESLARSRRRLARARHAQPGRDRHLGRQGWPHHRTDRQRATGGALQPALWHRQPLGVGARRRRLARAQHGPDRRRSRLPEAPLRRRHQGARENPEQAAYFIPAGLTGRSAFAIRKKSWVGRYGWRGPSHVPRKEASIMIGTNKFLMLDHCPSARCYGTASHRGRSVE
jgi:hypothetical protein